MKQYKRIFAIVMDSVGFGEMPDAAKYGDVGADTIGHIAQAVGGLHLPTMQKMGVGNLHAILGVDPVAKPSGYYTKMMELSPGKDTMTGHWEIMGLNVSEPFITFTEHGFPKELLDELEARTGHKIIGNKAASGTEIMEELGERHVKTGEMIVYTSADSVLQIAANEDTFGLQELYRCCAIAREITMKPEWRVGRIIARPFKGNRAGEFKRTYNRHDYALQPFAPTVLDTLKDAGFDVLAVGKINDIFDGSGITSTVKTKSNEDGMDKTIEIAQKDFHGLCFVNLVDFDALWGHRRNPQGYANDLNAFDVQLATLLEYLTEDDLLILTADHGNDPVAPGTDHTREMVPLIFYNKAFKDSGLLPVTDTFAYLGATIAENFGVKMPDIGKSLLHYLK
ncbi:MAG: phosphopentomutase [Erysipelotrichaceae bacterium]